MRTITVEEAAEWIDNLDSTHAVIVTNVGWFVLEIDPTLTANRQMQNLRNIPKLRGVWLAQRSRCKGVYNGFTR